jgi:hypothetical protein
MNDKSASGALAAFRRRGQSQKIVRQRGQLNRKRDNCYQAIYNFIAGIHSTL